MNTSIVAGAIAALIMGATQGKRSHDNLRVGDSAPPFTLKYLGKKETFELKSNLGKRPTVLIFGSYT